MYRSLRGSGTIPQPFHGQQGHDGVWLDSAVHLKNSRGFYREQPSGDFELTGMKSPQLSGATFYLFAVDVHTGKVIHEQFKWVNNLAGGLAVQPVLTGPAL